MANGGKRKQHNYLLPEEVYEQVWNRSGVLQGKKNEDGSRRSRRRTEQRGNTVNQQAPQTRLARSLPRIQSSRCSLAAGVSLPQPWSPFNERSMRTYILLPQLSSEVWGDVPPWRTLIPVSTLRTIHVLCCKQRWNVQWDRTANWSETVNNKVSPRKIRFVRRGWQRGSNHNCDWHLSLMLAVIVVALMVATDGISFTVWPAELKLLH